MSEWRSWHIYNGDVDSLILGCAHPFLERVRPGLERCFWERHYAGGPHLRVRLRGSADAVDAAGRELVADAERWLAAHPSPDLASYSPDRVVALMKKEGEEADPELLRYRNNVVEEHPYQPPRHIFASDDALALAEDFRHDSMPLAARVIAGPAPPGETLLRLFFLQALTVCQGDLPAGLVSCKSHWEGFAASFSSPQLVERIRATRERNRESVHLLMREVTGRYEAGTIGGDPVLAGWHALVQAYRTRTRADLAAGKQITDQPETPEEARQVKEKMYTHFHTRSRFVDTFWSDERFIASMQFEPSWIVPRVLINLLYQFVSSVGVGPVDRMALCYFAASAAEEHYGCDLADILAGNVARTLAANAGRWATAPAAQGA